MLTRKIAGATVNGTVWLFPRKQLLVWALLTQTEQLKAEAIAAAWRALEC